MTIHLGNNLVRVKVLIVYENVFLKRIIRRSEVGIKHFKTERSPILCMPFSSKLCRKKFSVQFCNIQCSCVIQVTAPIYGYCTKASADRLRR